MVFAIHLLQGVTARVQLLAARGGEPQGVLMKMGGNIPGPPNYRWFLVVLGYLKAFRNHLLGGTGSECRLCFFFVLFLSLSNESVL